MSIIVPPNDDFGQGTRRCRALGSAAVETFARRLMAAATGDAIRIGDVERELRRFLDGEAEEIQTLVRRAHDGCARHGAEAAPKHRRNHIFMRALVRPLEPLMRMPDGHGVMLSRRCILGFGYATTRILGPHQFTHGDSTAREIAADFPNGGDGLFDDARMRALVEAALIRTATWFHGDFMLRLRDFLDLVNARLSPGEAGRWDEHWRMERSSGLALLDALFRELRREIAAHGGERIVAAHGAEALTALEELFAGVDAARRIMDKPWRLRPIVI